MAGGLVNSDLQRYLLQQVQCRKYAPQHGSALARFLFDKYLFAECHYLAYCEHFGLHVGEHSRLLFSRNVLIELLEVIAEKVHDDVSVP